MMESAELVVPVSERDHSIGPEDAPVTLVQYGDFECPYCGAAYPMIKDIQQRMGDRLRFVFRNFPITTSHPHAMRAAEAAEAAGAQGKFWEMHDMLYEHQDDLADVEQYALKIGLEIYQFNSDLAGEKYSKKVRDDFRGGVRSGVNGTPTFFVNGVRYNGEHTYEAMLAALENAAAPK